MQGIPGHIPSKGRQRIEKEIEESVSDQKAALRRRLKQLRAELAPEERRKAGDSEEWADSLGCAVIKVEGTKPIWENVEIIAGFLSGEGRAETGRDGGSSQGRQI